MATIMNSQQLELIDHIAAIIEEHKRELGIFYSELKLRLPSYLKSGTIQQLKEAGAQVDPDITLPRGAEDHIRKQVCMAERFREIRESFTTQVTKYYANIKKELTQEIISKQIHELTEDEWTQLGIDIVSFRRKYAKRDEMTDTKTG